jgi:hypothetical protein
VIPTRANGQPAFGQYLFDEEADAYLPHGIVVLTLKGDRIGEMTIFRDRRGFARFALPERVEDGP